MMKKAMQQMMSKAAIVGTLAFTLGAASHTALAQYQYPSKVDIQFNRFYDYGEMTDLLHELVAAYPDLLSIETLGKSVGGREIWLVTLNNPKTGPDTQKATMFIDGNIHGNEIQAAETILYSIWYLTKSYGKIDALTELIDERAFYFVPMENPDGRDVWFNEPATPHYLRGGIWPEDDDHDGAKDEDPYDDLDGDGHITNMYRRDPLGRYEPDPDDPRFMRRVDNDAEPGGWSRAGSEGIDNDGDGDINEDGPGGYDPNRNWPSDWQPEHIQGGSGEYPFSLPETRAVARFLLKHPNIAAFQSYHNTGGMILRGPGADYVNYPFQDIRVYDQLQEAGEFMLPGYRAMVIWSDLYVVHGGEVNWAYEGLGITAFTNELWSDWKALQTDSPRGENPRGRFTELLQFDEPIVPYKPYDHPTLGEVLIGGTKKWSSRVPPPWLSEEDAHRNFAFTMFHAREMPKVEWGLVQVQSMGGDLWDVRVEVKNPKIIPTITAMARQKRIGERDRISVSGDVTVVASGDVNSFLDDARFTPVEHEPHRLWNDGGISGQGNAIFRFLVEGSGSIDVTYESQKGGKITQTIELTEQTPERAELPEEMTASDR